MILKQQILPFYFNNFFKDCQELDYFMKYSLICQQKADSCPLFVINALPIFEKSAF